MYYIEQVKDEFVKYEVILDKEGLDQLKYKILQECGEIIPHDYEQSYCNHSGMDIHIRDYSCEYVRTEDSKNTCMPDIKIYRYRYNQYLDTRLICLIEELVNGNTMVITELKNPVVKESEILIKNPTDELKELVFEDDIDTYKLGELKQELEVYKKYKKLNQNRKLELEFYPQVFRYIKFKEVERISTEKVMEYQTLMAKANGILEELNPFFEGTSEDILSLDLKK